MDTTSLIVGYDGSAPARAALDWALAEAGRHGAPVRLIHVIEWPVPVGTTTPAPPDRPATQLQRDATAMVDLAVENARATHPAAAVTGAVLEGRPAAVLCDAARHARMLVVGNRGRGALAELLLGSVAAGVVAHCAGPVMVVPGTPQDSGPAGPVVVGAGDAQTPTAWAFAYEAAAEHGTDLVVVRAWRPPAAWHSLGRPRSADDVDELETAERRAVWRALAPHGRRHVGVPVALRLVVAEPADALVRASAHARLVVVGARGRGTTAHRVIRRAGCPVAVVRERP